MRILFHPAKKNLLHVGLLYNRPTVNDPRELAPVGWRIPNLDDILSLINFYGGEAVAGGSLKALESWIEPNTGATSESIFKALPAGQRDEFGTFSGLFTKTVFWIK